jgi:hypothetical protein
VAVEHDPEKWIPVFRKDHAQTKDRAGLVSTSRRFGKKSLSYREQAELIEGKAFRKERAVADKPEFVDMISEATRQSRRRYAPRIEEPVVKERSRLSHWPPDRWEQWRIETLTPWKLKSWKFKNWS